MPAGRRALATLLALLLAAGCATNNTELSVPVLGRTVSVVTELAKHEVKGELLAVEKDRLFVRAEDGVREIPLGSVREARVKRHDFGAAKAFAWSLIGGLVTGGAAGNMAMDTKITLKENFIDAPGKLQLTDLHIQGGKGTVFWIPATTLSSSLKGKGNRVQISFHMKGNIEDPQFNLQEIFLTRIAISLLETLGFPVKVVGEENLEKTMQGEKGVTGELRDFWKK